MAVQAEALTLAPDLRAAYQDRHSLLATVVAPPAKISTDIDTALHTTATTTTNCIRSTFHTLLCLTRQLVI